MQGELFQRKTLIEQQEAEAQILAQQKIVDYQTLEYPIEVIVEKYLKGLEDNTSDLFIPKYQRKYVWTTKKASKFIESLLLGLPIPYIFTADHEGRLEIVDGSQRIRTLVYFFQDRLILKELTKLKKLNFFRYTDLPKTRQKRFNKRTIRIIHLTDKATWKIRKDIFERINTTPTLLTAMEIRRGVYEGKFMDFVEKCAQNKKFKILCPISSVRADREERTELVLRFFAYSENYKSFVHIVKDFVDNYAKSKQGNIDVSFLSLAFENMLDFVDKHFPYGFKKSKNAKSTPRVRFEALAVGVHLALKQKPDLIPPPVEKWLEHADFKKHTRSHAANNKNKVIARFEYVRDKLLGK